MFSKKDNSPDGLKKWPSKKQWLQFFKVLNKKEKIAFGALFSVFALSLVFLLSSFYVSHTKVVPSDSGRIREGVVGQPQFINPLYSALSDADKDVSELVFSGLMTYDASGNIVPDLISDYKLSADGKTFEFSIKENARWSDGKPLNIDDVIFTVDLVKDSEYLSPLRTNWQGVEIQKISDYKAVFKLQQAYSGFEENLVNLKIMPAHVWKGISMQAMTSNRQMNVVSPVGSGPYTVKKTVEKPDGSVKSMILVVNKNYYGSKPHIQRIDLYFYGTEAELVNNLQKGNIDAGAIQNPDNYDPKKLKRDSLYSIATPGYFAIFLNNQKALFSDKDVRQALAMATDKAALVSGVLKGNGTAVDSPIIPGFYGFKEPAKPLNYDPATAGNLLDGADYIAGADGIRAKTVEKSSGFQFKKTLQQGSSGTDVTKLQQCLAQDSSIYPSGTVNGSFGADTKAAVIRFQEKYKDDILTPNGLTEGTGKVSAATIKKLNEVCFAVPAEVTSLSFTLKTTNNPILVKTAELIKEQWAKLGIAVQVETMDTAEAKKVIRERDYDALLFGENLSGIPDPLSFWHSSQIIDPGLNLSWYKDEKADALLEKARAYPDYNNPDREKALESFQDIVVDDSPSVFLYSSNYMYLLNKKIKGFDETKLTDPSERFANVENWYISTKRVWK
jgi:ABC-type transport system substrate-binding protein